MPFIVVLSGELEIVRPATGGDEIVAVAGSQLAANQGAALV
jgi:hypothetical protein